MSGSEDQRRFLEAYGVAVSEGVWVPRDFVRMLGGNANHAVMLRQILYWWVKSNQQPFYKRHGSDVTHYADGSVKRDGWEDETGLRERQSRHSVARLEEWGYITTRRGHGYDNKMATYYAVNEQTLIDSILGIRDWVGDDLVY